VRSGGGGRLSRSISKVNSLDGIGGTSCSVDAEDLNFFFLSLIFLFLVFSFLEGDAVGSVVPKSFGAVGKAFDEW